MRDRHFDTSMMQQMFFIQAMAIGLDGRVGNFLQSEDVSRARMGVQAPSFIAVKSYFTFDVTSFVFSRAPSHS